MKMSIFGCWHHIFISCCIWFIVDLMLCESAPSYHDNSEVIESGKFIIYAIQIKNLVYFVSHCQIIKND